MNSYASQGPRQDGVQKSARRSQTHAKTVLKGRRHTTHGASDPMISHRLLSTFRTSNVRRLRISRQPTITSIAAGYPSATADHRIWWRVENVVGAMKGGRRTPRHCPMTMLTTHASKKLSEESNNVGNDTSQSGHECVPEKVARVARHEAVLDTRSVRPSDAVP